MLDTSTGIPPGMATFLRSARAAAVDGGVRLAVDATAAERLAASPGDRARLRDGFEAALGSPVEVEVVVARSEAAAGGERITQDVVREGRLRELMDQEPALERAVEELDLELLD